MKIIKNLAFVSIALIPSFAIRCKNFSWCSSPIPFTFLELLILVTFFAWLIWLLYRLRMGKESLSDQLQRLEGPLILPIGVFLLAATISLWGTTDLKGGLGVWKAYFLEGFLLYLVIVDVSLREKDYFWVLKALLISGFFISSVSIVKFLILMKTSGFENAASTRISSIYEFANAVPLYFGPLISLSASFCALQYKNLKERVWFVFAIIISIFMIGAIFLSQSKGGIVGIFSILVFWVGYLISRSLSPQLNKIFKYSVFFAVIFYFALNIFVFLNIGSFAPEGRYVRNSVSSRYCIWEGTKNLLSGGPIQGSGLNGFQQDYKGYKTCLAENYYYPHNILLTFWVETGILGLIAFLWLSFEFIKISLKGENKILTAGLIGAIVYMFIHGSVDVPFFKNDLSIQFWILLSLVTINFKITDKKFNR